MNLTKNFTLEEMERSSTANARKIVNKAPLEAIANLKALCENVLQPLRDWYGRPIYVSSGYRCAELNRAVGGVTNSQHKVGEAADIIIAESRKLKAESRKQSFDKLRNQAENSLAGSYTELKRIWTHIRDTMAYDQCILEHSGTTYWIHISWKKDATKNRKRAFFLEKK